MLISVEDLHGFWRVRSSGVVHVGAHAAEELDQYETYGFGPVIWIEAQPDLATALESRINPPSRVIQALIWDISGEEMLLKLTSNSQSSSVFDFGTHERDHPDVKMVGSIPLRTVRLDEILPEDFPHNFLNIDIQGAEYQALNSLGGLIERFDYVYLEVNSDQVYKGIKQVTELDKIMSENKFIRVATVWTGAAWGDALYIKRRVAEAQFKGPLGVSMKIVLFRLSMRRKKSGSVYHHLLSFFRRQPS